MLLILLILWASITYIIIGVLLVVIIPHLLKIFKPYEKQILEKLKYLIMVCIITVIIFCICTYHQDIKGFIEKIRLFWVSLLIGFVLWMGIWMFFKKLLEIKFNIKDKKFLINDLLLKALKAGRVYILYVIPSVVLFIAEFKPDFLNYGIKTLDIKTHIFFTAYVYSASAIGIFWLAEGTWFRCDRFWKGPFNVLRVLIKYFFWERPVLFYGGLFYSISLFFILIIYNNSDYKNVEDLNEFELSTDKIVIFDLWALSIASWLIPAVTCFWNFERGVQDVYFHRMVSGTIRKFKTNERKHKVLLGFGGLGKGVCEELLEREKRERRSNKVMGYLMKCEKSGGEIYLRSDMVIVDRDESLFDDVFIDPALEKIGIAKVKYKEYESVKNDHNALNMYEKEVWIPAIIGDVTNESVVDYCALEQSEFFIDTIKGYDEVIRISKFARDNRDVKGIITVNDSAQKEMLFQRHSGKGVFLCYATHQQGITLGEVVYAAMTRFLNDDSKENPKIMVFTDNLPQTQYMIETILQELKLSGKLESHYLNDKDCLINKKYIDLKISICSDHEEIKRVCNPHLPGYSIDADLDIRFWDQIIERCANPSCLNYGESYYIRSRVILEKPRLINMEKIIVRPCLKPHIVVISYKDSARLLQVLHEWMVAVERENDSNRLYNPKIIVGFRGKEHEEVRDYLQYYDARFQENSSKFPVQAIDARVDLNRDSSEHIGAIAEAMSSTRGNRLDKGQIKKLKKNNESLKSDDKTVSLLNSAIGIHIIDRNRHGTMPGILANLARLEFNGEAEYNNSLKPSFHYSRYQNCAYGKESDYFLFTSNIILKASSGEEKYDPENDIGAALLSLPSGEKKHIDVIVNSFRDHLLKVDFGKTLENDEHLLKKMMDNCLFQVTCSPESYRRKIYNLEKNKEYFNENFREKVESEKKRFYINHDFRYKDSGITHNDAPLARLYICCRHGNVPGALAVATNNLLFKELNDISIGKEELVFDIKFLINYFSYSPDVIYKAIYGNLVSTDKQDWDKLKDGVIERILICPITDPNGNSWIKYAHNLCKFLNNERNNERNNKRNYKSIPKSLNENNKNPENILIYTEDKGKETCSIGHTKLNKKCKTYSPDSGCDICRKFCWTNGFKP